MRNILVLGAGQSATYLIRRLLERAADMDAFVTVGDRDPELAARAVNGHARGEAITFDVNDVEMRGSQIERAEVVVNLLPQRFQSVVALDCLHHGRHMVSVSYQDRGMVEMARDAVRKGVLFLTEVGLDPGIDLMSAMAIIGKIQDRDGTIESFESYGSGVPAPEVDANPLRYCITWNPRNVAMAGEQGAQYLDRGRIKIVPWHQLFHHSWPREVPGFGLMEAYPNRDSLSYRDKFGLAGAETLIRGTLRYPGWSETWHQIVRLGLPNEHIAIPDLERRSWREIVEMFLPSAVSGADTEWRVANYLGISRTGRIMDNLAWLGLFDAEPCDVVGRTPAEALIHLLNTRLALPAEGRDVVILLHDVIARFPADGADEADGPRQRVTSSLIHYSEPGGTTAMAKTVGLPAAIAVELLLAGELPLSGCHIPTHPAIYEPILSRLEAEGLRFEESVEPVEPVDPS